jgi:hypothetical protein
VAKRAKITEDDAANLLGGDALDRFTGAEEERRKPAKGAPRKKGPPKHTAPKIKRVKATFYLNSDQVAALEELRLKHFKETGDKIDQSELVRKAIDLLASQ